jgi:hypothetical protein
MFIIYIEVHEHLVLGYVHEELTFISMRASSALFTTESIVLAVVFKAPIGENFNRIGINEPIQQVKMVGGFMNE